MTKILFFCDIHNDKEIIKKLKEKSLKYKPALLVCAGDISTFGFDLGRTIKKIDFGIPMLIIPGNHEHPSQIEKAEKKFKFLKNIHEKDFIFENLEFVGMGGTNPTPFNTPYEMSEKKIAQKLSKLSEKMHKNKKIILVTHVPSYNTKLDKINSFHVGSHSLRKFIEKFQPELNICGHIHENEGIIDRIHKTKIINPGPEGKIFDL